MLKDELEHNKKRVLITHYSDPLKQICRNWFGWDGRMDAEGRSFLQYIGTNIVCARQPDFWVDYTLGLLSMMGDEWDYVIIPDFAATPTNWTWSGTGSAPATYGLNRQTGAA